MSADGEDDAIAVPPESATTTPICAITDVRTTNPSRTRSIATKMSHNGNLNFG